MSGLANVRKSPLNYPFKEPLEPTRSFPAVHVVLKLITSIEQRVLWRFLFTITEQELFLPRICVCSVDDRFVRGGAQI